MTASPKLLLLTTLLLLVGGSPAWSQPDSPFNPGGGLPSKEDKLTVTANLSTTKARRGSKISLKLTLDPAAGYHTYPFKQDDPAVAHVVSEIKVKSNVVVATGEIKAPPPSKTVPAPEFNAQSLGEWDEKVDVEVVLLVKPDATPGMHDVTATFSSQYCDDRGCTPINKTFQLKLEVTNEPPLDVQVPVTPVAPAGNEPAAPSAKKREINGKPVPTAGIDPSLLSGIYEKLAQNLVANALAPKDSDGEGLWAFILSGMFWGFISLVTPCVFPMIPITVSFFLKQSEQEHHRPVLMALVYCGTIVGVLTVSALFLLSVMQVLSQHPAMNFFLGALFLFFAFSLFGWYEIELPTSLSRFTSSREGRGGLMGTVFMALTFTIISFACVAPFLGTFAGIQTQSRPLYEMFLGALAFSATFAAPFFFLALFPGLLRKMPKSGSWLNSVKVVMGFLEVAAGLGFLRAGELTLMGGSPTVFFTYDFVMAMYVILCGLCGIYLLGHFRTPHDSPVEHLSVPRLLWAIAFFGLAVYLLPALWKKEDGQRQRPAGVVFAWIDAFLLEEPGLGGHGENWSGNLQRSLDAAREHLKKTGQRKLVFIDFTGIICKNCRLNERDVFPLPAVQDLLKKFELVQLTTDTGDAEGAANQSLQQQAFGTAELPLYVILEPLPDGKIRRWGQVGGKINSVDSFVEFLRKPLENGAANSKGAVANK